MKIFRLSSLVIPPVLLKKRKRIVVARKYYKFNSLFFMAIFLSLFSVGLFNFAVDPYDIFKTSKYLKLSNIKPNKDTNDRLYKATDIIRMKPTAILLGSSRTKQGLDPNHSTLKKYQSAYNLALNGPNVYELKRYLQHAISNQKNIKEVVFGIDFFMFNAKLKNQPTFTNSRLEKQYLTLQDAINAFFSIDTVLASRETIIANLNNKNKDSSSGENGFILNRNVNDGATKWRFNSSINLYFRLHSDYQFSNQYLSEFKSIVTLCKQHGINLKVFISPSHATDMEAIKATGRWETFEQWKRELVKIAPIWDFSGYNSITTEPINNIMKNYADNSHYNKEIGDLIFNRIFSYNEDKVPKDFGILLTPENVEKQIQKIRADRERWTNKHPEEAQLVKKIKQQLDKSKKIL